MRSSLAFMLVCAILPGATFALPSGKPIAGRAIQIGADVPDINENFVAPCDLHNASLPPYAKGLPPPASGLQLVLIAHGAGTQNYTCANSTATPVPFGALASLTNITCNTIAGPRDSTVIGKHFFADLTTPEFDVATLGNTKLKKNGTLNAPSSADVAWLQLLAQEEGTTGNVKEVYRLKTNGGVAPANCSGYADSSVVTVHYTAQYWFYSS